MSENNGGNENEQDNFGEYRNNYNPNYSREHIAPYKPMQHSRRARGGQPWLTATLVLVAFLAGALTVRYVPAFQPALPTDPAGETQNILPLKAPVDSAKPDKTTADPLVSLPAIGSSASPAQPGDIPAIAKAVGPAVVGVVNKASGYMWNRGGTGEIEQGTGSGVIISADGYIVTNNHVISGADQVSVTLPGGEEVDAKIIGADEQTDLAVLKIDKTGLPAAPTGDSDKMQVGQTVIAIGNPLGEELAGTVTMGILSARDRELVVDGNKYKLFQTDAAINPGNSGGALVNMAGELIGINNLKSVSAGADEFGNAISAEGIGFAIPINDAMPIIRQLIDNGFIPRPMLGIDVAQEITQNMARRYNLPQGVYLRSLIANGPAEKAGIRQADIITEIDRTKITTIAEMNATLSAHQIGETAEVKIWRDGQGELTFSVTLEGNTK